MATPLADDERRHEPDDNQLWNESYYLDWFAPDPSAPGETIGGYLRVGFYPNLGVVWYWACLVGTARPLVTVVAHDVALPRSPQSLELRADGLWADHVVETALDHMSCNLEAFAVEVEDPADMYHGAIGTRVPFGFELDWETDRAAYLWPPVTPRYEIPCRVHGRVMVGAEELDVDGWGQRDHSWGAARDWWANTWCWSAGRLDDGTRWHSAGAFFADNDWGVAYRLDPDSTEFDECFEIVVTSEPGREGLVEHATLGIGDLRLQVQPLAWSPVLLVHPDGREARFPRALARFTTDDGRTGLGWIEFNQPPA
ncbi:MAG: hypothetical protein U0Q22_03275 [Acidimicrobiales bacterium]